MKTPPVRLYACFINFSVWGYHALVNPAHGATQNIGGQSEATTTHLQ